MNSVAIAPAYIHSSIRRRKNTWYSMRDGNWNDPNTWLSNAEKRWNFPGQAVPNPIFPAVGDDVYINHAVTVNTALLVVNNLYVSGSLLFDATARVLTVRGDIQATGTVNMSGAAHNLQLAGAFNFINSTLFNSGTTATVTYNRAGEQDVMDLVYRNLSIANTGIKYIKTATNISGNLTITSWANFDATVFDMTVNGTTVIASNASFFKSGGGNLLFIGQLNVAQSALRFELNGNPTVETRGGLLSGFDSATYFHTGTGVWNITTNNQTYSNTINVTNARIFGGDVLIVGAITLTIVGSFFQFNTSINGTNASSALINKGGVAFNSTISSMSTGIYDLTTFENTVAYIFDGNMTLPTIASYRRLYISGSGIKELGVSTTVSSLIISTFTGKPSTSSLDLAGFNFISNGITDINSGSLLKTSSGSVLFAGQLRLNHSGASLLDFSTGNPSVELRNGLAIIYNRLGFNTGDGVWTFSTNNQTVENIAGGGTQLGNNFNAQIIISGAINVTVAALARVFFLNSVNGNNASSTLSNMSELTFGIHYQASTQPMVTGLLDTNAAGNNFRYNLTGNQDVKGGTYRTIEFGGSGAKRLLGNVVVNVTAGGSQSTTGTATIDLNGFTITTI